MATTEFYTPEYLADLAADGFAPAPARRPVALEPGDFYTEEYVQAVLADLAEEAARQAPAGGDGDDPDGGPAAPSAARPLVLALVAAHAAPAWVELGPAEESALDAFERAVAETWDPVPCDACGRPASPAVETDEGVVFCVTCGEAPSAPPAARLAVRDVRITQTARRLACARLSRELAGVVGAGAAVR